MQQNKNQQLDAKFRKFIKVLIMIFILHTIHATNKDTGYKVMAAEHMPSHDIKAILDICALFCEDLTPNLTVFYRKHFLILFRLI